MNIKFAAKTDVGKKRKLNEDSFCAAGDIGLFLVADGMGGHSAGEIASQTTVEVIKMRQTGFSAFSSRERGRWIWHLKNLRPFPGSMTR